MERKQLIRSESRKGAPKEPLVERAREIFRTLKKTHRDATIELKFSNPVQLLIATVLSAQCTDVRVNQVTANLFRDRTTAEDFLELKQSQLEEIVKPTGFFRNKAKNILAAMRSLVERHGGEVPQTMEELVALPGVGRKTANVILGNAFSLPGLPVDTHVMRVSKRLGITKASDPVKIERELHQLFVPKDWCLVSHTFIFHGRRICKARKPSCDRCPVTKYCEYFKSLRHENPRK